jgi:hypothetical protein|nr:MAG TPA: hypothetical protein [Caudoviricetes sp.]
MAVRLSLLTKTGLDFYMGLPVEEFLAIAEEVIEYGKENRIRNSSNGRR